MRQKDIILQELLAGKTVSSVQAFVDHGIMALAGVITEIRKELKKQNSDIKIRKYTNNIPNENGVVIPYAYYYINECNPKMIQWPPKTTDFVRKAGETKTNAIVRFMIERGSITTIEGFTELYAYRIGAGIKVLRNMGYIIETTMVKVPGRKHSIAKYTLVGKEK